MRLAVSGDAFFLKRHAPLFTALQAHVDSVAIVAGGVLPEWLPLRIYNRLTRGTSWHDRLLRPDPNPVAFGIRSRQMERALARLQPVPDLVLHVFCSFAPQLRNTRLPFVQYLDYTMAQARREWPEWASFHSEGSYRRWIDLERRTYGRARHLFVMSERVKDALAADYGIAERQVTVVGSGGHFDRVYDAAKSFGTNRVLFDGSAFIRKGGDILVAAIADVRRTLPSATLVMVGGTLDRPIDGVINPGHVSDPAALRELFLSADLVASAARCDPFPGFIIEALNYGVPCVVSQPNGLSSAIRKARAGRVVDALDAHAFAEAILSLLSRPDTLPDLSSNARRVVAEQLNWKRVAEAMAPTLQSIHALSASRTG